MYLITQDKKEEEIGLAGQELAKPTENDVHPVENDHKVRRTLATVKVQSCKFFPHSHVFNYSHQRTVRVEIHHGLANIPSNFMHLSGQHNTIYLWQGFWLFHD